MILRSCGRFCCLQLRNLTKHTEISYPEHIGWLVGELFFIILLQDITVLLQKILLQTETSFLACFFCEADGRHNEVGFVNVKNVTPILCPHFCFETENVLCFMCSAKE